MNKRRMLHGVEIEKNEFWINFIRMLENRIKGKLPEKATEAVMLEIVEGELKHIHSAMKKSMIYGY